MSIFVDGTFDVEINYEEVVYGDKVVGVKMLPSGHGKRLVCEMAPRDFDQMSAVLENCTIINHVNGQPMVRVSSFYRQALLSFCHGWNVNDPQTGQPVPITREIVGVMHDDLVKGIVKKWLDITRGKS